MHLKITYCSKLRDLFLVLKKKAPRIREGVAPFCNVHLIGDDTGISFVYTDMIVTRRFYVEGEVIEAGSVGFGALDFEKTIKSLYRHGGSLEIRVSAEELEVSHARLDFTIPLADAEDMVAIDPLPLDIEYERLDSSTFIPALKSCLHASCVDEAKANICGIYFEGQNLVGVDAHRLRCVALDGHDFATITAPNQGCEAIVYAEQKLGFRELEMAITDGQVHWRWDSTEGIEGSISAVGISDEYPDYRSVLPKHDPARKAVVDRDRFLEDIALVSPFSEKSMEMLATLRRDSLDLRCSGRKGQGKATVPATYGSMPVKAAFNYGYLEEALKDLPAGPVVVDIIDTLSPATFFSEKETEGSYWIIMPMRL